VDALDEGSERYYSDNFRRVFGSSSTTPGSGGSRSSTRSSGRTSPRCAKQPITPYRAARSGALGSISRLYYDEPSGMLYGAFRYQGVVEHVGALEHARRAPCGGWPTSSARCCTRGVVRLRPAERHGVLHQRQPRLRDLMAVDVHTGKERMLLEDARIGDIAFNPVDRSLIGVRHDNGLASLVRIPYPYDADGRAVRLPYEIRAVRPDISADGRFLSASMSEVNADQYVRVWEIDKLARATSSRSASSSSAVDPESFVFSKDGRYLYGSSYYTGVSNIYRYEVATATSCAMSNAETGFFRPVPLADGRMVVLAYTAQASCRRSSSPSRSEDSARSRSWARKWPRAIRWYAMAGAGAEHRELRVADRGAGAVRPAEARGAVERLSGAAGLQEHRRRRLSAQLHRSDRVRERRLHAGAHVHRAFAETSAFMPRSTPTTSAGTAALSWNRSDFYDLFGPTKRSRKGLAVKGGYDSILIYDEPRRLDLLSMSPITTRSTRCPTRRPCPRLSRAGHGGDRAQVHGRAPLAGRGRRREGHRVERRDAWQPGAGHLLASAARRAGLSACACRWATPRCGSAPPAGWHAATGRTQRQLLLRRVRQQLRRRRDDQALPRVQLHAGFKIDEISARSFVRELVEWNAPPSCSSRSGTPAST
jgi:hypothetical protein